MNRFDISLLWKLWLISIITVNCNAAVPKEPYQNQIPTQGLYNTSDDVVILNVTNFKSSVYEDTKSWLVEFYNSWCGYCLRFAPIWKDFANDIYAWRDIVVVAAIDCADDDNNPICREYEIMHYPMLKYFSVNAHSPSLGLVMEKYNKLNELRHSLIDLLEREQQEGRGISWPNIAPYRSYETTNIWKAIPNTVKYFFLLFEKTDSHLGAEVILDIHKIKILQMRRVLSDNELLCETNKITNFPSLIVLGRNETQKNLKIRIPTRQGIYNVIKEFITSKLFFNVIQVTCFKERRPCSQWQSCPLIWMNSTRYEYINSPRDYYIYKMFFYKMLQAMRDIFQQKQLSSWLHMSFD